MVGSVTAVAPRLRVRPAAGRRKTQWVQVTDGEAGTGKTQVAYWLRAYLGLGPKDEGDGLRIFRNAVDHLR